MTREDQICRVLAEIVHRGLLNIRGFASQGNADACFTEADHLHNLPHLIADFREELLEFYCDTERQSYLNAGGSPHSYEQLWAKLDSLRSEGSPSSK